MPHNANLFADRESPTPQPARTRARRFDFRRPNKLNRDHLRNLQMIHETFAGQLSTLLSSSLRSVCTFTVDSMEEVSYGEFVREISVPTHLSILSLDPLPGVGMFHLSIDGAMAIVEMLLGGGGVGPHPERALTDIEASLIRTITERSLPELRAAFEPIVELSPRIVGTESNPQFARLASPSEMVLLVNFKLTIAGVVKTSASLCYPYTTIQPLLGDMVGHSGPLTVGKGDLTDIRERLAGRLHDVPVDFSVAFQPVSMRSREILSLGVVDIVALNHPSEELLTANVDNVALFKIKPARKGRRVAAQVVAPINRSTPENR
ncbi:MAG TPA: FliM/FliN family flagellar motor switch protein [Microthrixaceae bacterium]|nr:FliM/FliN family flagellar motor switch protein [Microthrixaceae bacterium]